MGLFDFLARPKSGAAWATEELLRQVFPGGQAERSFKADVAYRICNGKCDKTHALAVYTDVASRWWLSKATFDGETKLGVTAEFLMTKAIEASDNRLNNHEAARMVHYVILAKEEGPNPDAFGTIRAFTSGLFGSNGVGTTMDTIPSGVGEFGHAATNPIPLRGIASIPIYFGRLKTNFGKAVEYQRIRGLVVANIEHTVDEYSVSSLNSPICNLYLHGYNQRISRRAPTGFRLELESPR